MAATCLQTMEGLAGTMRSESVEGRAFYTTGPGAQNSWERSEPLKISPSLEQSTKPPYKKNSLHKRGNPTSKLAVGLWGSTETLICEISKAVSDTMMMCAV